VRSKFCSFVANGLINKEISAILQSRDKTARNRAISLLTKLEAKDPIQAVTFGIQRGLIRVAQ